MIKFKSIFSFLLLFFVIFYGCREEDGINKFERPNWLAGKIYTQILEQPELSVFAKSLELTGYDTIINTSGSYTVFAPSNQAFDSWLKQNSAYNSVESMPLNELSRLVSYHIVQNPWTKTQLRTLDVFGWIDTLDLTNNKPRGFKRETLLREPNQKFGLMQEYGEKPKIVDTLKTNFHRKVYTDSRKYAPVFFQEYFDIYELNPDDYEFYFNRSFEGGNSLYFANGKIISDEIFAENGFIYIIDQVVKPPRNAYEILEKGSGNHNYSQFFDILNSFPEFQFNQRRTLEQVGADEGLQVDSLFDLTFPDLTFNITSERTQPPSGTYGLPQDVTIRYHHGLLAPINTAFEDFINQYFNVPNGWGDLGNAPNHIKRIIANTHMSTHPVYLSDIKKGFVNGENDNIKVDPDHILQREYGSNSTFIGLNKTIVPRAFSSVTGPVYLSRGFSKVMYAIEQAGLLPVLKRENKDYMFFVESDMNSSIDSSLIYNPFTEKFSTFVVAGEGGDYTEYSLSKNDLQTLLLNHIAINRPRGIARKEFIPNMTGSYIIVNNETGEISGTDNTTVGYNGSEIMPEFPRVLAEADNGTTYEVNNWFSFASPTLYLTIASRYPAFHSLLRKAGYDLDKEFRYSFISNSEVYTIFVPTQDAIESEGLSSLPIDELRKVLLTHFVQGELIFTDGNLDAGYYNTLRPDEKSTPFSTVYSQMFIDPGIDIIRFQGQTGTNYLNVNESQNTNLLAGINQGTEEAIFPNISNNAVIHEIDKVLIFEELDTQ